MSRLRRLMISHRIFFATTHFAPAALPVVETERDLTLGALAETRAQRKLLLFGYCVMPTHVHVLFAPALDDTFSGVMREFKLRASKGILTKRKHKAPFWQARSFDRIIRNKKEWGETLDYIHWNPVKEGWVKKPSQWRWSSWFGWSPGGVPPIPVDRIDLPADEKQPLGW